MYSPDLWCWRLQPSISLPCGGGESCLPQQAECVNWRLRFLQDYRRSSEWLSFHRGSWCQTRRSGNTRPARFCCQYVPKHQWDPLRGTHRSPYWFHERKAAQASRPSALRCISYSLFHHGEPFRIRMDYPEQQSKPQRMLHWKCMYPSDPWLSQREEAGCLRRRQEHILPDHPWIQAAPAWRHDLFRAVLPDAQIRLLYLPGILLQVFP